MKKIVFTIPRPRNPLAVPARFRRAGAHLSGGTSRRQQANRDLARELDRMKRSP